MDKLWDGQHTTLYACPTLKRYQKALILCTILASMLTYPGGRATSKKRQSCLASSERRNSAMKFNETISAITSQLEKLINCPIRSLYVKSIKSSLLGTSSQKEKNDVNSHLLPNRKVQVKVSLRTRMLTTSRRSSKKKMSLI